ncbi:MAG: serine/threonine protein phosphatase [Alphaproteobacteria bacterium]|nr:MAG: serine/threonine protein phosphatase [Alphaproteobacteria bacterium]
MSFLLHRPRVPPDHLVFAIGDIHGCLSHLEDLQQKILAYAANYPSHKKIAVYLGDYIDRGPSPKGVIDNLLGGSLPGFDTFFLKGNHEQMLLDFMETAGLGQVWFDYTNGGRDTIHSYGVAEPKFFTDLDKTQKQFIAAFPGDHLRFFQGLKMNYVIGDYYFVHAGVHPGRPLQSQLNEDMLWIREPFLSSHNDYGKIIVHGHTIVARPDVKSNRIAIDTGAFWSGVLTALVLHDDKREFLQTVKDIKS